MAVNVSRVKFNNGLTCPILGLGTWQDSNPGEVTRAVGEAIDIGYRHIDCAHLYFNEKEVGEAINEKIKQGIVKREDLLITSKLWNTYHRPDLVEKSLALMAVKISLSDLGLDYLDLDISHSLAYGLQDANGKVIYSDVDYMDTWKAMEKLVEKGLVKSIGVSNFNSVQLTRILNVATIKPVTNQGYYCYTKVDDQEPYSGDIHVWDFSLTKTDIEAINSLDSNGRLLPQAEGREHKDHPFTNPDIIF